MPFIACWPGKIAEGWQCAELTISLDVMPTILSAAGVKAPPDRKLDGVDMLPILLKAEGLTAS